MPSFQGAGLGWKGPRVMETFDLLLTAGGGDPVPMVVTCKGEAERKHKMMGEHQERSEV